MSLLEMDVTIYLPSFVVLLFVRKGSKNLLYVFLFSKKGSSSTSGSIDAHRQKLIISICTSCSIPPVSFQMQIKLVWPMKQWIISAGPAKPWLSKKRGRYWVWLSNRHGKRLHSGMTSYSRETRHLGAFTSNRRFTELRSAWKMCTKRTSQMEPQLEICP